MNNTTSWAFDFVSDSFTNSSSENWIASHKESHFWFWLDSLHWPCISCNFILGKSIGYILERILAFAFIWIRVGYTISYLKSIYRKADEIFTQDAKRFPHSTNYRWSTSYNYRNFINRRLVGVSRGTTCSVWYT